MKRIITILLILVSLNSFAQNTWVQWGTHWYLKQGNDSTDFGEDHWSTLPNIVAALNSKQPILGSGTNIKTIKGQPVLGSGDIPIVWGDLTGTLSNQTDLQNAINLKANLASPTFTGTVGGITSSMVGLGNVTNESKATMFTSPTFTGTVSGITSTMVGLGNVNNTSDANKPISTATQTALDAKQATLVSGTNIKTINGLPITGPGDVAISGTAAFSSITGVYTDNPSLVSGFANKQDFLGRKIIAKWQPAGNSTTITAEGAAALTATGTATAASVGTTNKHSWSKRLEYLVTVAATTAVAGWRGPAAQYAFGNAAGRGGFTFVCRFGPATGVTTATHRLFVGMANTTAAPTDVEPSSIVNIFGVGYDAADANIQFMRNDGSGTATKIDLGASFPVPTADRAEIYELYLFCTPNSTSVSYEFINLSTGVSTTGSVNTDLPTNTTFLAPRGWMSVGGSNSVIGIALMNLYIQTDY